MARLVVGMARGTGFGAETLAIAQNGLGSLHLAGAAGASTGRRWRHHQQTTPFSIAASSTKFHKKNQSRDKSKKTTITILTLTPAATRFARSKIKAINSEAKQPFDNNHEPIKIKPNK